MWTQGRRDRADASQTLVLKLSEQVVNLLRETGATEEEAQAALDVAKIMIPLQELDSVDASVYLG